MGGNNSAFTDHELETYQELTYLTKKEIIHIFKRFQELDPVRVKSPANAVVSRDAVLKLTELKENPFNDRIFDVFSSSRDDMTFEDFLDMMSVFSDAAPQAVKAEYAFRIYDFDGDEFIGEKDIVELIQRLIGGQKFAKGEEDIKELVGCVFEEADLDDDKKLSYAEFEHILSRAPDFMNTFRIRV